LVLQVEGLDGEHTVLVDIENLFDVWLTSISRPNTVNPEFAQQRALINILVNAFEDPHIDGILILEACSADGMV
jgi:hypothetical protein